MSDISGVGSDNMLRLTGMATGMDTDATIKKLMAAENMKVDKMKQAKQLVQWKQESYRDVIKDLRELRSSYLLWESPSDTNLVKSQGYTGSTITSSNSNCVNATALPGALNGDTKIEVTQIAKAARLAGSKVDKLTSLSIKLSDLGVTNGKLDIELPSGKVSVDVDTSKISTVQDLVNTIYSTKLPGSDQTLYSKVKINFSELTNNLTIESRETGENIGGKPNTISISGDIGIDKLGLGSLSKITKGQDAIAKITPPGSNTATEVKRSSNAFTIDNVTYTLKSESTAPVNLTTAPDSQKSFERIKGFIDKYNGLVKKVTDKLSEKKNLSYKPLTEAQKKDMKDDQIKAWEEKAKAGTLRNEGDLQNILYGLRNSFMEGVKSAGINLKDIGIDTYDNMEAITKPGQMKIDEDKLKDALQNRGDQVMKLFTSIPDNSITDPKKKNENTGIFRRIEDIINKSSVKSDGTLMEKAGYTGSASETTNMLTKQLQKQDKAINELAKKLAAKQEKYYQMFARLETAMNKLNSQQNWLAQQMAS